MNLDEVWGSRDNTPAAAEVEVWIRQSLEGLKSARRRRVAFLVWTFAVLSVISALATMIALSQPSELTSVPAVLVLLAAQWAAFGFILRQALKAGTASSFRGATIRDSLERLHREATDAARRTVVILGLFAVALPTLWAAVAQLRVAGKMAPHEASSAAVVFTGILVLAAGAVLFQRYRVVLPRRARLDAMLRQYGER